jgi:hypothetical protein
LGDVEMHDERHPLRYCQRIAIWFKDIHDTEADTDSAESGFFTWDAAPRESRLAM